MPNATKTFLQDYIKPILSIGGGMIGGEAGPFGALGGASLGNMAGQSIENLYNGSNGTTNLPSSALAGAIQEAGGQVIGKGVGSMLGQAITNPNPDVIPLPDVNTNDVLYHGSNQPINNPKAGMSSTGFFGDAPFYTTRDPLYAKSRGIYKTLGEQEGTPAVSSYYPRNLEPNQTISLFNLPQIEAAASQMGGDPADIQNAYNNPTSTNPAYTLTNAFNALRRTVAPPDTDPPDLGNAFADAINNAGIRRIESPIIGTKYEQQLHYNPDEDLISQPTYDAANQQNQTNIANYNNIKQQNTDLQNKQTLVNLLSQSASRQVGNQ